MAAPFVAVPAYHLPLGRITGWSAGGFAVPDRYLHSLHRAGLRGAILPSPDPAPPEEVLAPFDGLLLIGGGDVEPARYGQEPHQRVYGVETDRDTLEIGLACAAMAAGMPVFAICRGMQLLNVALGGNLHQHLGDLPNVMAHGAPIGGVSTVHSVRVAPGSRLAKAAGGDEVVEHCTSHHHQSVDRLGDGLEAVAWSDDGLVEAVETVESAERPGWLMAVQWHPEITAADDPGQQRFFDAFAAEVRAARS